MARDAVFNSWNNPRAITYRRLNDIPGNLGTAVNVQAMVFGNMGDTSATGVGFHPQPLDGRQGVLRRVPDERPGRGRGGRHPHAAPHRRSGEGNAGGLRAAPRDHEQARKPLPRRAGLRVHRAGRHALHAPDPHGQAHGPCGGQDRRGHGQGGAHYQGRGGPPRGTGLPRPAPPSRHRPQGEDRSRSPRAFRPRRAPPPARSCSRPTRRCGWRRRRRSSWSGRRPRPTTFTAWTRPRASSRRAAA